MKKALLVALSMVAIGMSGNVNVSAQEKSYALTEERFEDPYIVRTYQVDDAVIEEEIVVPIDFLPQVQQADDPLLTAKKEMYAAYKILNLEKRMQVLTYQGVMETKEFGITIDIPYELKEKLRLDAVEMENHYQRKLGEYQVQSEEQKKTFYDTEMEWFQEYKEDKKVEDMTEKEKKEFLAEWEEEHPELAEYEKERVKGNPSEVEEEKDGTFPFVKVGLGLLMILCIGGILYIGIKQKRG